MPRIRPTHRLSARREGEISCSIDGDCPEGSTCGSDGICVDAYDTPLLAESDVIGGTAGDSMSVRFHVEGVELTRSAVGEEVDRSPAIEAIGDLSATVNEGDIIALEAMVDPHDDYADLEARAVIEVYGRGARPRKTIIQTEDV